MRPATTTIGTGYVYGKLFKLEPRDASIRLAGDRLKDRNTEWNDKAFLICHDKVVLDVHEWDEDDTDYDSNPDLCGAVYYDIMVPGEDFDGSTTFVVEDGGVFQYGKDSTLFDLLVFVSEQVDRAERYIMGRGAVA